MSARDSGTERVLDDLRAERERQVERGWTREHDDAHATHTLATLAERRARTFDPHAPVGYYSRARLVQAAALLVAAVEAIDRREGR